MLVYEWEAVGISSLNYTANHSLVVQHWTCNCKVISSTSDLVTIKWLVLGEVTG